MTLPSSLLTRRQKLKEIQRHARSLSMLAQFMQMDGEAPADWDVLREDGHTAPLAPDDLRDLVSAEDLARFVEDSVARVSGYLDSTDHTRSWEALLEVLNYSYAIGVYASDNVEDALENFAKARPIHQMAFQLDEPTAVLRSFRHANRAALEHCLCHVVQNVCPSASGVEIELEAARRVVNAIEADTWALDA